MNRNPNAFLKEEYDELVKKSFDWKLRILESGSTPHSIVDGKEVEKVEVIEAKLEARELDREVEKMIGAVTKTYLTLWFSSEGKSPTSVVVRLQEIGFKPTRGEHDFVFDWGHDTELKDLFKLGDTVHKTLKGSKVFYRLETL